MGLPIVYRFGKRKAEVIGQRAEGRRDGKRMVSVFVG
jgi:hypothetical protein